MKNGSVDIGMLLCNLKDFEKEVILVEEVIVFDGIVVVVYLSNVVKGLIVE